MLFMFDHQELELLLCGVPVIDVDEWERHTVYKGRYNNQHQVVKWFWALLETMDDPITSRLGGTFGEERVKNDVKRLFAAAAAIQAQLGVATTTSSSEPDTD